VIGGRQLVVDRKEPTTKKCKTAKKLKTKKRTCSEVTVTVWGTTHLEEGHGRATSDGAVLDFRLFGEVVGGLDGRYHSLHGEERREVGRV